LANKLMVTPGGAGVSQLRSRYQDPLWILFATTGLVLLIACAKQSRSSHRGIAVREAVRCCLCLPALLSVLRPASRPSWCSGFPRHRPSATSSTPHGNRVGSVAGIGQHHPLRDAPLTRTPDLVEGDFGLGLKLNRIRHSRLLPPLAVFDPGLRQVQAGRPPPTPLFPCCPKV